MVRIKTLEQIEAESADLDEMMKDTTPVQIPKYLHKEIKVRASEESLSMKAFVRKLYGIYVNQSAQ